MDGDATPTDRTINKVMKIFYKVILNLNQVSNSKCLFWQLSFHLFWQIEAYDTIFEQPL